MPVTALWRPDEATTIGSPRLIRPPAIVPAKPRKSRCGRLTHCTGRRNGAFRRSSSTSIAFEMVDADTAPRCQGVCGLDEEMLSPTRAEIGIATSERKSSGAANALKASTMRRNVASS